MSSFLQPSSTTERTDVWRPVVGPSTQRKHFTQNRTAAKQGNADPFSCDTMSTQTVNHSSHLSENLQTPASQQAENLVGGKIFSRSLQSATVLRSGSSASSVSVKSLQQINNSVLEEKNSTQGSTIDLTQSYKKKPPILSPKPSVAPKPKTIGEFSPKAAGCKFQTISEKQVKVKRANFLSHSSLGEVDRNLEKVNNKSSFKFVNSFRNPSHSAEEETVESSVICNQSDSAQSQQKVKQSQTLPCLSNNTEDVRRPYMDQHRKSKEKMSVKNRPQVAAKPKFNWNSKDARIKVESNASHDDDAFSDSLVEAPFSRTRSKFEEMKINFKKPAPDPVFQPRSQRETTKNPTAVPKANELFKDILEMKTLEGFGEANTYVSQETSRKEVITKNSNETKEKNEKVAENGSKNYLPNVDVSESKYKKKKENNAINSITSPNKENNIFNSTKSVDSSQKNKFTLIRTSSEEKNHKDEFAGDYNPSDVPAPFSPKGTDLMQIDFMDLPPPPDLPSLTEKTSQGDFSIPDKSDKNFCTTHLERNVRNDESAVFCHRDKHIASGSDGSLVQAAMSNHISSFSNDDNNKSKLLGKVFKSENSFNRVNQCESKRDEKGFSQKKGTLQPQTKLHLLNSKSEQAEFLPIFQKKEGKLDMTSSLRNFEEEIIYYDNMDIMEKVRIKREQDEKRLCALGQQEENFNDNDKKKSNTFSKFPKVSNHFSYSDDGKSKEESDSGASDYREDFQSALGNLDNEYKDIEENLEPDESKQGPPKLPPKQHKFNRKQAIESADKQISATVKRQNILTDNDKTESNEKQTKLLRLQIGTPVVQCTPHVATPVPVQQSVPLFSNNTSNQNQQNSQKLSQPPAGQSFQHQQVLSSQYSAEDARARQLVDEPLAPIMEEDSTYSDSSSCASSLRGDESSIFDDNRSIQSFQNSEILNSFISSTNAEEHHLLFNDENDDDTTESELTLTEVQSTNSSESTDDVSKVSSVQWQNNPLQSNSKKDVSSRNNSFDKSGSNSSTPKGTLRKNSIKKKWEGSSANERTMQISAENKNFGTRKVQSKRSQQHSSSSKTKELNDDVEPYGMVDLTSLQPKFTELHPVISRPISHGSESELTTTSIMNSVNQFNANQSKSPVKSKHFSFDSTNDPNDMPNFPLDVEVNKASKEAKSSNTVTFHQHNRNKSRDAHFTVKEQPGYDNLENYGGGAKSEAEKTKSEGTSRPENHTASVNSKDTSQHRTLERKNSADSLSSEPGLAKQAARSRASFPLPVTESMLSRHSSAVRAVDRHSGNLKRAKESGAFNSFTNSPSSGKVDPKHDVIDQTSPQAQPRSDSLKQIDQSFVDNTTKAIGPSRSENFKKREISNNKDNISNNLDEYDQTTDDGFVNPYEEVPFLLNQESQKSSIAVPSPDTPEQEEAKTKVKEILDNIKPPDSPYRPKPPMPRYPVDYDNFYLGKTIQSSQRKKHQSSVQNQNSETKTRTLPSALSDPDKKKAFFTNSSAASTPCSTPALVRAAIQANPPSKKLSGDVNDELRTNITAPNVKSEENGRTNSGQSLGSHIRYFLGGGQDNKHVSPGVPRKKSILKRSKSPGGSQRSKSPSKLSTGDNQSVTSDDFSRPTKTSSSEDTFKMESAKSSESDSHDHVQVYRSASQRLVERRGRLSSQKSKTSEDESTDRTLQRHKKGGADKSRMSSRWRRSKSQDRESPTRSKSKERKFFGRRSKSQERPDEKECKSDDVGIAEDRGRKSKSLRRSRSSSRKRDKREKSSDRSEGGNSLGGRGRNPVRFIKKLLGHKKNSDDDIQIVHLTPDKSEPGGNLSDSTEALSTILAYKAEEAPEKEEWNLPRPNPPQQTANTKLNNHIKLSPSTKSNKALRSPPSRRAKKFSSSLASGKTKMDLSTGSSSEGIDRRRLEKSPEQLGKISANHLQHAAPKKPIISSRKSSFSNSIPSSDSEQLSKHETSEKLLQKKIKEEKISALKNQLQIGGHSLPLKAGLRRNFLNRDYDSDTATSVLPSDADSSADLQSDADSNHRAGIKSTTKLTQGTLKKNSNETNAHKKPVRVISPQRSKSDPSIFVVDHDQDNKNTYFNIEETKKSPSATVEKKRPSKATPHKRRNPKQVRRQTAPVDLAYEAHQRQKYKTLVSLNSQTLRKVTEKWLSEWRNQLPVGGFLITSWSDVALSSHRPMCMIANSVVYGAVSTGSKRFQLACQLYDQTDVNDKMTRKLDNCSSLPAHPNTCGVCSHFNCRVPRSLLDPSSGGGAADAICVVLTTRPHQSLQDFLKLVMRKNEVSEFHRQLLVNVLQLLQGLNHLESSGFDLPNISQEHLVITEDKGFLQILPHLQHSEQIRKREEKFDSAHSSDSDCTAPSHQLSIIQQVGCLIKRLLQNCNSLNYHNRVLTLREASFVISKTKYSSAIKHIIKHFEATPMLHLPEAAQIVQCALWGPDNLDDLGVDDVSPYAALELWIEMEQAKLVNSLAVLASNERLVPSSFLKHQFFANVTPQPLFNSLKILQRI